MVTFITTEVRSFESCLVPKCSKLTIHGPHMVIRTHIVPLFRSTPFPLQSLFILQVLRSSYRDSEKPGSSLPNCPVVFIPFLRLCSSCVPTI